ncbi:hypothetical protein BCR42DRAFT_419820 [Absidia repens]|uniref:Attractin/MKLN-like beta-propeller domain-containing protein n=1 Tax=Absidia repens TaxID=90262 RepID=A0A1X2IAB3_9FUNG|nr:hypothetical protein BCR42DRAFT_419820 [Absidia repens]
MFLLFFLYSFIHIQSILAISGRVLQACTVLEDQVFCYGGYSSASGGVFTNVTNDHYTLDLKQADLTKARVASEWTSQEPSSNSPPLEPRSNLQIAALDNNRYMILGGRHGATPLNATAVIYDKTSNSWTGLAPPPPFDMSEGAMVASDANTVWAYGGKLNGTSNAAPNNILKMDISSGTPVWNVLPMSRNGPPISRYGHAQAMRNNVIYFFGGFLNLPEQNLKPNVVTFNSLTWYNTQSDQWGNVPTNGDIPTPRKYLTATLLPNSSQVLLYGGTATAKLQALPLSDYCYIYDANKHQYTAINLTKNGGAGGRIGHSAVAYKNRLLILMGYDGGGNILNDVHALDISNPEHPVWAGETPPPSDPDATTIPDNSDSQGLATGAIVGIVIGCVAFVAIVGAGIFLWYRKRRQRENSNVDYITPPQDFQLDVPPTMFAENTAYPTKKEPDHDHSVDQSNDPVPSYPVTKPHEEETNSELPRTKPSSSE